MIYIDILNTYSTAPKGFAAWLSWTETHQDTGVLIALHHQGLVEENTF